MKLLYLSYFSTPETFAKLSDAGLSLSEARQKFDETLINNLRLHDEVYKDAKIISYLPYNKKLGAVPSEEIYYDKKISYVWTKRNSIFTILRAMRKIKKLVKAWLKETKGQQRIILTYAANPILLAPVFPLIKKDKIVTVCSEVPKHRNMTEGNKIVNAIKKRIFAHYNEKMNGYIYMSKHMNEVCNKANAPWIVVEGMTEVLPLQQETKKDQEIVFYAGGLHYENGIDVLVESIIKVNEGREKKVVLQLCGVGNFVQEIKEYSSKNEFIQYLGSLPNEEILLLEKKATLLINPRKADNLLTKYSFPSKTIEYFVSGTPAMITKLEGIPNEYYNYCYVCDSSSTENLAKDIDAVLSIPMQERLDKAKQAYDFINNEKSAKAHTKRILDFLEQVSRS